MKTYKIITYEDGLQILKVDTENKTRMCPMEEGNPYYEEYLRYTAWVEAGNTPEDFWTQDDELDTSVPEVTEPKEEETTEQPSSTDTKIETDLGE